MGSCSGCGGEVLTEFRFCPYCGNAVIATVAVQERRVVSVLFCDVVGYTAETERQDPEDVRARMEVYFRRVRQVIEAFGGSVEKFIGDAVMAVFGVPAAHEDDAERAVRAGLEILGALAELNAADPTLRLSVRVGVNTGEVLASLGAGASGEGDVLGDVVNTAARIQSAAPVDGVLVGLSTFRASESAFEWEALESIAAKGKAEPVAVWRALAPRARLGSRTVRLLATPLVGRERELAMVRQAFARVMTERSPRLVTIMGEPGVGKSRLVAELRAHVGEVDRSVTWREGRCLPYGEGIAFWPLAEIVKTHAGIYDSDPPDVARAKLEAVLPAGAERPWFRARLLPLLGLDPDGTPARQEELFTAWRRFLEYIAERRPLVMVVEDVHWAGEPMLAFLAHLAGTSRDVPLMVVCTTRPELADTQPSWVAGTSNAIPLAPLATTDMAQLVFGLLEHTVLPAATRELLLERAGGNPLYAEEFVSMLRDRELLDGRGALKSDAVVPFPDSLQALIAARLDTLSREQKTLVQDAAVVGNVFWDGSIATMGDRDGERVQALLRELAEREFVRPAAQSSMEGEEEYAFRHILVRDVAYAQIPRAHRAARHIAAATWLEAKASDRLEDLAEILAYHTGEALSLAEAVRNADLEQEIRPRAARYALLAGEGLFGLDVGKALSLLDRARALTDEDDAAFPRVLLRWGDAALHTGELQVAAEALGEASEKLRASGDVVLAAQALTRLSTTRWRRAEQGWLELAEEAVELLEPDPGPMLVRALGTLSGAYVSRSELEKAIATAGRAIALAARLGLPEPATALAYRGGARFARGDVGGVADQERAIELAIGAGSAHTAAAFQHNLAAPRWFVDGPKAGIAQYERAHDYAIAHGLTSLAREARTLSVLARVGAGELQNVVVEGEELLEWARAAGGQRHRIHLLYCYATALTEGGADARTAVDELLEIARDAGDAELLLLSCWAAAPALLAAGNVDGATALIEESAELDADQENPDYAISLARAAHTSRRLGAGAALARLTNAVPGTFPIQRHTLTTVAAIQAELAGDVPGAASLYAEAASGWEEFTAVLEQAHALMGEGRCLALAGDASADDQLRRARALFEQMGAHLGVRECDELIAGASVSRAAR